MKIIINNRLLAVFYAGFMLSSVLGISYVSAWCSKAPCTCQKKIAMNVVQGAHRFTLSLDTGAELSLADLKGKVVLFVNTAAKCGFASQYKELEALYQRYKDEGFVVIGVSSNDFHQEIKGEEERACYLDDHFPTTFLMTQTVVVTGKKAHPLYQWLNKKAGWFGKVKWNFHKFLVGKDGQFIDWYLPTTKPDEKNVARAIEKALAIK